MSLFYGEHGDQNLMFAGICVVHPSVEQDRDVRTVSTLEVKSYLGERAAQEEGGYELVFIEELPSRGEKVLEAQLLQ